MREILEARLDPNDPLGGFLGFSAEILQTVRDALEHIGLEFPSVPCGTRFSLYLESPTSANTGGEITIALFAPL